jgi:hypothetical protein
MDISVANPSMLGTQIGAAAVCAYAIQLAQKWSKLPWITEHTASINMWARIFTSGVAALGVSWAWGDLSGGGHSLTIALPSGAAFLAGLWHWFQQYAVQHGWGNLLSQPITARAESPYVMPTTTIGTGNPGAMATVTPPKS